MGEWWSRMNHELLAHGTHRRNDLMELIHHDERYRILGACFEVYKEKGCGFLEAVFQECLGIEFGLQGIPAKSQVPLTLSYKGHPLQQHYVADFICCGKVVVELKAVSQLTDEHWAQIQNYTRATGKVEHERFVL
jgi:GxxExxY protein